MELPRPDFRQTWLWQHVFVMLRQGITQDEQRFFAASFLAMREKVEHLVGFISTEMSGLTVHDLSHLDALWGTASIVTEGAVTLSPAEGFVLGAAMLIHDSAMTRAAYEGGVSEIQRTVEWKDAYAKWRGPEKLVSASDEEIGSEATLAVLPDVLRRLHAKQAAAIVDRPWKDTSGVATYLIEDNALRYFYAKTIGTIAQSHWWSVDRIGRELSQDLGAYAERTNSPIDLIKLACILRIADGLHLDNRRAPRFLRMLINPVGHSALHWDFQERIAHPHVEADTVVFTSSRPFQRHEADAWWLAYDTLSYVDHELSEVEALLRSRNKELLKARRVKGATFPEAFSRMITTEGWRPVDARMKVTDVPRIVESLGGSKLYGNDPRVSLRELIQNAADAIQARRRIQKRNTKWGEIRLHIRNENGTEWLIVEDNGIGMSELVLTGPLLDFGTSFWRSPLIMDEFPGLVAAGMAAIGRFGIGFFSVFMLGDSVRVISRRYDRGEEDARTLEISGGAGGRPMLSVTPRGEAPMDGGTRVEVRLKIATNADGGLLKSLTNTGTHTLGKVAAALAPSLNVRIVVGEREDVSPVVEPNDWLAISELLLLDRLDFNARTSLNPGKLQTAIRPLCDDSGTNYGRAAISVSRSWHSSNSGWVTVCGLKSNQLWNVDGIMTGEATTAVRNIAIPLVPQNVLAAWATEQAVLIAKSRMEDERKACAAEVVLECGGKIGQLPICKWAGTWLTTRQFIAQIRQHREMFVYFEGEVVYDEDEDEVHPREFKEHFKEDEKVVFVPRHNGSIIRDGGVKWPTKSVPDHSSISNLANHVVSTIHAVWKSIDEDLKSCVVGTVHGTMIERQINLFYIPDIED